MTHPIWQSRLLPLASLSLLCSGSISAAEQVGSFAFLGNNESFAVSDAQQLAIWGGSGSETLLISGTPVLQVDANVERIEFPNALADYTFAIQGTQISILSGATAVVSLYGLNGDLTLVFADGAAPLQLSGLNSANLGDAALSTTAGSLTATLNTQITSSTADGGSGTSNALYDSWVLNTDNERARHIADDSGQKVLVNIQSVTQVSDSTGDYAQVSATGIPDYVVSASQDLVTWLNSRPKASSDFIGGATTISAGDEIQFGQNIGYDSTNQMSECGQNEGFGYWPPGPVCPEDTSKVGLFPESPEINADDCDTGLSAIGYAINGVSMYGWSDGQSYNSEGAWQSLAPLAEVYDVDICGGHAANGDYHHHFYSACWAETAGDTGTGHSPVYGFAADGYPVYGPWHDTGVIAQSCWKVRDFTAGSATGCDGDGVRNCVMVDQYDPTAGVTGADAEGPTTSGTYTSLSGNTFDTTAGFFFEDYYYDSSCSSEGEAMLDQYNGHEHDDLGYHYHVTITSANDTTPAFPYMSGPRFRGKLQSNAITSCSTGIPNGGGNEGGGGNDGGGGGTQPPPR